MVRQLHQPLCFVDFLREAATDAETGEVLDAHPSVYESVPGGLPELRCGRAPCLPLHLHASFTSIDAALPSHLMRDLVFLPPLRLHPQ